MRAGGFLLNVLPLSDPVAGVLLLALALALLISCLVLFVKLLNSVMRDRMSSIVVRTLNLKFPGRLDFLSGAPLALSLVGDQWLPASVTDWERRATLRRL